jgi:hypothetical protein
MKNLLQNYKSPGTKVKGRLLTKIFTAFLLNTTPVDNVYKFVTDTIVKVCGNLIRVVMPISPDFVTPGK